jgi:hypothetical protein
MFAADSGTGSLYTINLGTGASTLVGPYGSGTNVVGLAFLGMTTTPEPGTLVLLGAGLALTAFAARRKASRDDLR